MPDPQFDSLGFCLNLEMLPTDYESTVQLATTLETVGFDSIWTPDSRLATESLTMLGALSQATDRIDLCSGVAIHWTRNVALMAQTWSTLYELAGPRLRCGLGAWWEPLATKAGLDRDRPLRTMWEYCTVLERLLALENVTYDGEVIQVEDVELDLDRQSVTPRNVPLYIGATGLGMNEMAGELVGVGRLRGSLLNAFVTREYTESCTEALREGVERQGGTLADVDRPQYIAVSMAADADEAIDKVRTQCAKYLASEDHFAKACNAKQLAADIRAEVGGLPAGTDAFEAASELVPDDLVRQMTAAGTPEQCVAQVHEYCEAGCTEPVLYPVTDNVETMAETFAAHSA